MPRRLFVAVLILLACSLGSCRILTWGCRRKRSRNFSRAILTWGPCSTPALSLYDPAKQSYTISGSGENMWFAADAFQFVWKKMSGDVTLTADISFLTKTGNEHKKAVLMLRQSLDADSVYADVALHASGLTSLQFRDEKGALTREIQSNVSAPKRLRIAKRGDYVYMAFGGDGEVQPAGGWLRIPLQGTFYVGLGVCSHDKDVVEQAVFSNVELTQPSAGRRRTCSLQHAGDGHDRFRRSARCPILRMGASKRRTGRATALPSSSIARAASSASRWTATSPFRSTPASPPAATTITASRPTARSLAISDNSQGDHESLVYIVPDRRRHAASHHAEISVVLARLVARRQDAGLRRRSATATSISTRSRPQGGARDAPDHAQRASTMVRSIRRTASTSTSIPNAPATCRSGA